jgi:protein SCO1/2
MVSPPLPKPKFTLTDTSNSQFDFALKTQGSTTLLFFGYTDCPDMCPMQMHLIAQALKTLPPEVANQFKVVFVTTDPDRDTPQVLRNYLDHFDKNFIGLRGSQSAVEAAQVAAKIPPAKKSAVRAGGAYDVGHASFVLAYTKDNLAPGTEPSGVLLSELIPRIGERIVLVFGQGGEPVREHYFRVRDVMYRLDDEPENRPAVLIAEEQNAEPWPS